MGRKRRLAIDADVLVYESAFAAQKTRYCYRPTNQWFDDAAQAKAWCEGQEPPLDYKRLRADNVIYSEVQALPEGVCNNILQQKIGRILEACGTDQYELFLSGDGNFREEYAVTKGYKANRQDTPKPIHYLYVRSLVHGNPRTICTVGVEADDALGIEATLDPELIIATIDKDLNMIPGRHYDWNKQIKYKVNPADAIYWFCRQLLTGDSTDNIPGLPGVGEKKAEGLLAPLRGDSRALFNAVVQEYNKGPFTFKDGTVTAGPVEYLSEQGILLWMQRVAEERWTPDYFKETYL